MESRPEFDKITSFDEFTKYYWYREELSQICKSLGLEYRGTKQELNYIIEQYFKGNLIKKSSIKNEKKQVENITLDRDKGPPASARPAAQRHESECPRTTAKKGGPRSPPAGGSSAPHVHYPDFRASATPKAPGERGCSTPTVGRRSTQK